MKNGKFSSKDVKRVCEAKLDIKFRQTKECNGWVTFDDIKLSRITVPLGRKPISPKLYKSMANQLNLTPTEFDDLLECPLTTKLYFQLLQKKGIINI